MMYMGIKKTANASATPAVPTRPNFRRHQAASNTYHVHQAIASTVGVFILAPQAMMQGPAIAAVLLITYGASRIVMGLLEPRFERASFRRWVRRTHAAKISRKEAAYLLGGVPAGGFYPRRGRGDTLTILRPAEHDQAAQAAPTIVTIKEIAA